MENVSIIGLDLAKNVFQAHGARSDGSVAFPQEDIASQAAVVFRCGAEVPCRHGGLRQRAPLGAANRRTRATRCG